MQKKHTKKETWKVKKYTWLFIFLTIASVCSGVLYFIIAYLFQNLITQLSTLNLEENTKLTISQQYGKLFVYLAASFAAIALSFITNIITNYAYYKLEMDLSFKLFKRQLLDKNISKILNVSKDKKLFLLTGAMQNIVLANGISFINFFSTLVFLVAIIATLGYFAPLALTYIIPLALVAIIVPMFFKRQSNKFAKQLQEVKSNPYKTDLIALNALKSYKLNNSENLFNWYKNKNEEYTKTKVKKLSNMRLPLSFSSLFAYYTIFLLMILCTMFLTIYQELSIGVLSLILLAAKNLADKGVVIIINFYELNNADKIANETISKSSKSNKEYQIESDEDFNFETQIERVDLKIEHFGFDNQELFSKINFNFANNQRILISGASGSGKTTFLRLLIGSYETLPTYQLSRNNLALNNIKNEQANLYKDFYLVKNNANLYPGTILENITFGDDTKNDEAIKLSKLFNLTIETLESNVSLDSVPLSVGQTQRVAILQAILSGKRFLIFDDSFSNIDVDNTEIILNYLKNNNYTFILVSNTTSVKHQKYFTKQYELREGGLYENA
ncbi:ATP-binding cassette domain-containing protein [Mycoplasma hafezii]|uniref:ATP-binding cassette domain-containing protein n=1 Tax=Mycoplasma hafezii TaxID=525886 RepID=UPI003CF274FF